MNNDIWIKVFGIVIILLLLKISMNTAQAHQTCNYDCPICVSELPPTNETICIEKYGIDEENLGECMWLLENQPALQ